MQSSWRDLADKPNPVRALVFLAIALGVISWRFPELAREHAWALAVMPVAFLAVVFVGAFTVGLVREVVRRRRRPRSIDELVKDIEQRYGTKPDPYPVVVDNPHWEGATGAYGLTVENPARVGGLGARRRTGNATLYLSRLRGPSGEAVTWNRVGSAARFPTPNSPMGGGLVDRYEVTVEGRDAPVSLFLDIYDPGEIVAPEGFTLVDGPAPN